MAISAVQGTTRVRPVSERRFFVSMSLAMALATLVGFGPTYYWSALSHAGTAPALQTSVHIHGALNTAWILLLIAQTWLVAAGRRDIHRLLGVGGAAMAAGVLASGLYVALHSHRRVHTPATADTLADPHVFLIFPVVSVVLFALFVALGLWQRRRPDAHKRLMLLATISMITPALARIVMQAEAAMGVAAVPGVVGAVVLLNGFLAAVVVHDLATRGRLHPVTLWGGGILLLSEPLRFVIGFSGPWQAFARMVMN